MNRLIRGLKNRSATIGVVGMGYVGLPLALSLANSGFRVMGMDIDGSKIKALSQGKLTFARQEPGLARLLKTVVGSKRGVFTDKSLDLAGCQAFVVTVQTPLIPGKNQPDYRALTLAVTAVAKIMRPGSLLVVQSTIAPGTSRDLIAGLVEKITKLKVGRDIFYAYVPERVRPGEMLRTLRDLPRIIGADDNISAKAAKLLYQPISRGEIDIADVTAAEITKTAENANRFLEINYANALALICQDYGVSYQQVHRLANKRDNIHLLQPGVGVGGHCIPKDPWLLVWQKKGSLLAKLFRLSDRINRLMAERLADLVEAGLKVQGLKLAGARLAVLGYSFREGSDDVRTTPAKRAVALLRRRGAKCQIHDPLVPQYQGDVRGVLKQKDAVVVLTAHDDYRKLSFPTMARLLKRRIIIDGRQTWDPELARRTGFVYFQIGDTRGR